MKKFLISTIFSICAFSSNACSTPSFRTFHAWGYAKDYTIRVCEESNPVYKDGAVVNYKCGKWLDAEALRRNIQNASYWPGYDVYTNIIDYNIVYPTDNSYGVVVVKFSTCYKKER